MATPPLVTLFQKGDAKNVVYNDTKITVYGITPTKYQPQFVITEAFLKTMPVKDITKLTSDDNFSMFNTLALYVKDNNNIITPYIIEPSGKSLVQVAHPRSSYIVMKNKKNYKISFSKTEFLTYTTTILYYTVFIGPAPPPLADQVLDGDGKPIQVTPCGDKSPNLYSTGGPSICPKSIDANPLAANGGRAVRKLLEGAKVDELKGLASKIEIMRGGGSRATKSDLVESILKFRSKAQRTLRR